MGQKDRCTDSPHTSHCELGLRLQKELWESQGPQYEWEEGSPCFQVFHALSPKSGGQILIDHPAKAAAV